MAEKKKIMELKSITKEFFKNKALDDLNLLVEKGYLSKIGRGSHKVYVRAEPQVVKSENP